MQSTDQAVEIDQKNTHPSDHGEESLPCCELHSTNSSESAIVFALVGGTFVLTTFIAKLFGIDQQLAELPAVVGALLLWFPLLMAAGREIKRGRPSSAVLVALAIGAAFASGDFTTAGFLAFILFIMDKILVRTAEGAHRAIEQLVELTPRVARILIGPNEDMVSVDSLRVGDRVRILPGENLPVDGTIESGSTNIQQSSLTGESAPVDAQTGDSVYAGTTNLTGSIIVEVSNIGSDTAIGKVVSLIAEAEHSRNPRQQIIEMVARHYVWVVLMVALAVWILSDPVNAAGITRTQKAISVLIVTCPGALLLASPTAMVAAFASAARLGVMIKSTEALESAAQIDTVVLDKTGTITSGNFSVGRLLPADGVEAADLLSVAATAEQHSDHPLANAILETAKAARVEIQTATEAEEVHGLGVKVIGDTGTLYVGRAKWLSQINPVLADIIAAQDAKIEGMTSVHVMLNDQYLGAVGLEDTIRPEAIETIHKLREAKVKHIAMLTGDRLAVANRVGVAVGVDSMEAECHPEEKHDFIAALTGRGRRVMMVGDGINDGPSLAAADVGVAMGMGGTDIAANSAGIALMTDDLSRLPFVIQLAGKVRLIIAENIGASILIAIVGLALAASGNIGVLWAAAYHFATDVFVIGNSFRLVRFGEEIESGNTEFVADSRTVLPETRPATSTM